MANNNLNLYDVGWDNPGGHLIRKDQNVYYGFFTRVPGGEFNGNIALHGLSSGRFRVMDYVRNHVIGEVTGSEGKVSVSFRESLLLLVEPVSASRR